MKRAFHISILIVSVFTAATLKAQESIFTGLKSDLKKADQFFGEQAFHDAIVHYKRVANRKDPDKRTFLMIAESYYMLNDMLSAREWYLRFHTEKGKFDRATLLHYVNTLQSNHEFDKAIDLLTSYQNRNQEDIEVSKKIWQLRNINFLYEDSVFYEVKPISINSEDGEFGPVLYNDKLIFTSNREEIQAIKRMDATTNKPFFNWYQASIKKDSSKEENINTYSNPVVFGADIDSKYHKGNLHFIHGGDAMVFIKTSERPGQSGQHSLKMFFARRHNDGWEEYAAFPFNSNDYSVNHPFMSADSSKLYFTSDMPGGYGGTDIYQSKLVNGKWSQPINLGKEINTSQDEGHCFIHGNTFYFSSDGHPGLGGGDIFQVNLQEKPLEVSNPGYPVNSPYDDFGLILDTSGQHGYLVTNRDQVNKDDIYEVNISRPSYPITLSGTVSYKDKFSEGSSEGLKVLPNAKLELIEATTERIYENGKTDQNGHFSIQIPFESRFLLKVSKKDFGVAYVSMEIPRNPKDYLHHEIVIVEDLNSGLAFPGNKMIE